MFYGSASKYAVLAAAYMAEQKDQTVFTLDEIASGAKVPKPYLSKILKQLVQGKIMRSNKGPGGGYQFARPAADISLYDVKIAVDGVTEFVDCALGLDVCNDAAPCPAHFIWKELRMASQIAMQKTTLPIAIKVMREKARHPEGSKKVVFRKTKR